MRDSSSMSDFEINKSVAKTLNLDWSVEPSHRVICVHSGKGNIYTRFNPCNNPADAWPIIIENRISLVAPMSYDSTQDWMAYPAHDSDIDPTDTNPLRAAMLVFLMMKDEAVNTQGEKV